MPEKTITVLCYGDSNTYGYRPETGGRYPFEKRWPNILASMLGEGYTVVSEGLNSRTTAYDYPDCAWKNGLLPLASCLGTSKPVDHLLFMLGTNDCKLSLGLTAEDIAAGMEKLVRTAKELLPEIQETMPTITVIAPAAVRPELEGTPFADDFDESSVRKSRALAPLYRAIAEKYGCRFLDCTDRAEVSRTDCIHLTEQGHRRIAEAVYELMDPE